MFLGWILRATLLATAVTAVVAITVNYLDKNAVREVIKNRGFSKALTKKIINDKSVVHVNLDAISDDGDTAEIEICADAYDASEIGEGDWICL